MSDIIRLKCSKCSKTLKVPDKYAGRVVACPACKQKLRVPQPVMEAQLADDDVVEEPEVVRKKRKPRPAGKPTKQKASSAMSAADWFAGILLFPICPIIIVLWAMRRDPKWKPLLGLTVFMFAVTAGVAYWQQDNIMEFLAWQGQEDRIKNDPLVTGTGNPLSRPPRGAREPTDEQSELAEELRKEIAERQAQADALMKPPTEKELLGMDEIRQRAYRANVGIKVTGFGSGSGVICKIADDKALILTNRHVIDPNFQSGATTVMLAALPPLEVNYIDSTKLPGKVVWVADGRVDLALVEAECPDGRIRDSDWQSSPKITLGESVFTVGNPVGLGWTYTQGSVSAVRKRKVGDRDVPIVQIDATINRGNSGGGLYNQKGQLIGINTSIVNPTIAQRLGFAIQVKYLRELKAPGLDFGQSGSAGAQVAP